jgi:hypothetical protein
MTDPEWLSPRKLLDYYVDHAFSDIRDAERELFVAVIAGDIRSQRKGIILGPEWRRQIANMKADDNNPFALPPDIELSVEDAKRKWPVSSGDQKRGCDSKC